MSKSISLRLDDSFLDEIDAKCDTQSCTRSDFIKQAVENVLHKQDPKPAVTEVKEKTVLPSFIPAFYCVGCTDIHQNEAYASRPKAYCKNCGQFAKEVKPQCVWCFKLNTLLPLQDWYLDKIGIPYPNYDLR